MYYRTCHLCGANLDPGERCDCMEEKEKTAKKYEELLTSESNGQMILKEAYA